MLTLEEYEEPARGRSARFGDGPGALNRVQGVVRKGVLCVVGAVFLAGCVSNREPEKAVQTTPSLNPTQAKAFPWARVDGQRMTDNADLSAQAQVDLVACKAETPPIAVVGVRGESCMKERGYYVRDPDR